MLEELRARSRCSSRIFGLNGVERRGRCSNLPRFRTFRVNTFETGVRPVVAVLHGAFAPSRQAARNTEITARVPVERPG